MAKLFMCKDCLSVFTADMLKEGAADCPLFTCYGDLFEIDELMIPIITILRTKGYDTKFCCAGHYTPFRPNFCKAEYEISDDCDTQLVDQYIMIAGDCCYDTLKSLCDSDAIILNKECFKYEFETEHCLYGKAVVIRNKHRFITKTDSISSAYDMLYNNIVQFINLSNDLPEIQDMY